MPRHDDRVVRRHQVFLGPVLNRTHALLHSGILHRDTTNTAVGSAALLSVAVDHIVIVLVDDRAERPGDQLDVRATATAHRVELHLGQRAYRMIGEGPGEAVLVIDRHPGVHIKRVIAIGRHHRVPGHDPLGYAPVIVPLFSVAAHADAEAPRGLHYFEFRAAI